MGSEKKRKRKESGATESTPDRPDKAERKRLKRLLKEAANGSAPKPNFDETNMETLAPALVSPIATPMAGRKLTKSIYRLIGNAAKVKCIRRGIKEVVIGLRKGERGVAVLAGDVFPVDVIAHMPLLFEEANVPYCFVPRKSELGGAGLTKRPTSVVLVMLRKGEDAIAKELEEVKAEVAAIQNLF